MLRRRTTTRTTQDGQTTGRTSSSLPKCPLAPMFAITSSASSTSVILSVHFLILLILLFSCFFSFHLFIHLDMLIVVYADMYLCFVFFLILYKFFSLLNRNHDQFFMWSFGYSYTCLHGFLVFCLLAIGLN